MKRLAPVLPLLLAAIVLASEVPVRAGLRIVEVDPEFPDDVTTYWFQAGKVRVDGALEGLTMIIDVKGGEGWLFDAGSKRYAGGPLKDLAAELARADAQAREEAAAEGGAPGEEAAPGAPAQPAKPPGVEIKDKGPGERLLGYETRRHSVVVDGELVEELWIAPKLDIAAEVDPAAFAQAMRQMLGEGNGAGQGYEDGAPYRALRATGYPLRQILYFIGEKSTLEVKSVAVQSFPAADFAVPKGFKRVGYAELLLGDEE